MLVSIFGKIEYGDYQSVMNWTKAHEIGHRSLSLAAMRGGKAISSPVIMPTEINDDWFGHHGLSHMALQRLYQPDVSVSSVLMASNLSEWLTESKFYAWHQMHDAIHTRLNNALGVH